MRFQSENTVFKFEIEAYTNLVNVDATPCLKLDEMSKDLKRISKGGLGNF